ncbi:peroxiredoxin-like family protein [Alteromonas sp. ASW11-36]|uniref:Peroxiredoxin-like family protein n=1 Tax=Alteromonas arenosi TaxID=3055817 RepID=A0ABT7SSN5_9ALTE|nr:peroxiredoxin-like family protein [Alteromonas sp. ASW11-36]MDM7859197.1 peroxiredoxin-like family protein [Alteromonas sp. ASW11-36]
MFERLGKRRFAALFRGQLQRQAAQINLVSVMALFGQNSSELEQSMRMLKYSILSIFAALLSVCACAETKVAESADEISPLLIGQFVPQVTVKTEFGGDIELMALIEKRPTVIIFYRGGWCPYCSRQMAGLVEVEQRILDLGYQILAISPDSPARLTAQRSSQDFEIIHLSDMSLAATVGFGLAYYVDDEMVETIRGQLGAEVVTLEDESKVVLPVPAAYIIDTTGLVKFAYVNPNFQQRINPNLLYQAARLSR